MWRLFLASMLLGGVLLGRAAPALALDYEEPVVPGEFLLGTPLPAPPTAGRTAAAFGLLAQRDAPAQVVLPTSMATTPPVSSEGEVAWERMPEPGPSRYLPRNQWVEDPGGCAVWDWTVC
ncbi:MAG TPA: hypothetical protein VFB73_08000 [Chloroflexota bacterium]|nr:hypothetical protein [Chloroflexota bacterium]